MASVNSLNVNSYGYSILEDKPTQDELDLYYEDLYYQENNATYRHDYSLDELINIKNRIKLKHYVINKLINNPTSLIDIGCGEGWTLDYFCKEGWNVFGVDQSIDGSIRHNKDIVPNIIVGDVNDPTIYTKFLAKKFDVVWLDNVLEHILEPDLLLQLCKKIMNKNSILMVEVPNDNTIFQNYLYDNKYVQTKYWVKYPDHINYFNKNSLNIFLKKMGFANLEIFSDWPIETNLLNDNTNYVNNHKKGKSCHQSRLVIENYISSVSLDQTIALNKALVELGIGRQLIGFYKLSEI